MANAAAQSGSIKGAPKVNSGVLEAAVEYMYSDTDVEMGGFFVGELVKGVAVVEAAIPALKAPSSRVNLTFDHDTWTDVVNTVDRDHAGKTIVGWFHSHPGHGVFLSGYDLFIQNSFFVADGMVALVVDPTDGALGWFVTKDKNVSEPIRSSVEPANSSSGSVQGAAGSAARTSNSSRVASVAIAALIAFLLGALGGYLYSSQSQDSTAAVADGSAETQALLTDQQTQLREGEKKVSQLESDLEASNGSISTLTQQLTESKDAVAGTYVIVAGDTLSSIAEDKLGDSSAWSRIYNYLSNEQIIGPLEKGAGIPGSAVGQTIKIPQG